MTNDNDSSTTPLLFGLPTPTPHLQSIKVIQNAALRVATGCRASTPVEHLHHEMMELPVSDHMHMLGAQFLASTVRGVINAPILSSAAFLYPLQAQSVSFLAPIIASSPNSILGIVVI